MRVKFFVVDQYVCVSTISRAAEIDKLNIKAVVISPSCKCAANMKGQHLEQLLRRAWFRGGLHLLDTEACDHKLSKALIANLSLTDSPLRGLRVLRLNNTQGGKVLSTVLLQCKRLRELYVSFCEKPSITGNFSTAHDAPAVHLQLSTLHLNGCSGLRSGHVRKVRVRG